MVLSSDLPRKSYPNKPKFKLDLTKINRKVGTIVFKLHYFTFRNYRHLEILLRQDMPHRKPLNHRNDHLIVTAS